MKVAGIHYRSIWQSADDGVVEIIDQTKLPHVFETKRLETMEDAAHAIRAMLVRGAPLIGATAAYGLALALRVNASDAALEEARAKLLATRPTAVNLRWALDDVVHTVRPLPVEARAAAAFARAAEICDEDARTNKRIGEHALALFEKAYAAKQGDGPLNVLTHCNAGWLATVDWGTALAPMFLAHDKGLPIHVWVDETRPRNQGAG
ncbi:MAG: S-methyl-5-thioribose-1-phosphate isomerase, partial [Rhodovibrionaceae bacterium]|nr:S-methyl-5-thioribose-1-phosphate isomerase [Rhodovibrionaceae bacterium]